MTAAETRDRLLEVAEELFATHGVEGASLRDITSAAGANLAAVNYHFGSKEGLLKAIVLARGEPLGRKRIQLLDLAEQAAGDSPPTVRALIRAFVEPVVEMRIDHPHFPRLLGRLLAEDLLPSIGDVFRDTFYETLLRFVTAFSKALPEVPADEIRRRLIFTVGAFHFSICARESVNTITRENDDPESLRWTTEQLVTFCEAGLCAPATPRKEAEV